MSTIYILILLVLFFVVNLLLRKVLSGIRSKAVFFGYLHRYLPVLEFVFWTGFVIWAANVLFGNSSFHYYINFLIITLGFIAFSWFFMRDYISGVQIKSRFSLTEGQSFKSSQVQGVIKKMGLLFMELKAENGSEFKVPYAQLDQKSIELNFQEKSGGESTFQVRLDKKLNEPETLQKITELIINAPWGSHKSIPVIRVSESEDSYNYYDITCKTIGENGAKQLKLLILNEFSRKKK